MNFEFKPQSFLMDAIAMFFKNVDKAFNIPWTWSPVSIVSKSIIVEIRLGDSIIYHTFDNDDRSGLSILRFILTKLLADYKCYLTASVYAGETHTTTYISEPIIASTGISALVGHELSNAELYLEILNLVWAYNLGVYVRITDHIVYIYNENGAETHQILYSDSAFHAVKTVGLNAASLI